ncbi:MAG: hypothetical protein Q4D53_00620, partial [Leptotrichiaceae bacterium]|nr:hypothetical protein [Leptotrichiaceae bacterium]
IATPKIFIKLSSWICIALGIFFSYIMTKFYMERLGSNSENSKGTFVIPFLILLALLLFVGMGIFLLKILKNIYFYEDGFTEGKEGEKNYYKDLHYFFIPGILPNTLQSIFYQKNNGEYRNIAANLYPENTFKQFQKDVVDITYPIAMENIEHGGTEEFSFISPKNQFFGVGRKKVGKNLKEIMKTSDKIRITKEYIAVENEIYPWNEYQINGIFGNIVVNNREGKKMVRLLKLKVDRPNLLEALIETFRKKS